MLETKKSRKQPTNEHQVQTDDTQFDMNRSLHPLFQVKSDPYALDKQLQKIAKNLKTHNINYLKEIWLSSYKPNEVIMKELKLTFNNPSTHLKQLYLDITNEAGMLSGFIKSICWNIGKNLFNLTKLSLYLSLYQIREETILILDLDMLQCLKNLKEFSLELYCFSSITAAAIQQLGLTFKSQLKNIEYLSLTFDRLTYIKSIDAFRQLTRIITRHLNALKHLELKIQRTTLISKEIRLTDFHKGWRSKQIEKFSLKLINCDLLDEEGLKALADNITFAFSYLKDLELYFEPNYSDGSYGIPVQFLEEFEEKPFITNEGIERFFCVISTNLKRLKRLSVALVRNIWLTDKGVGVLSKSISENLSNLTSLSLNFSACRNVTSKGIKDLIRNISKSLPDLRYLSFSFYGCQDINQETLDFARSAFSYVQDFHLNF